MIERYSRDYAEGQETLPLVLYEKATMTSVIESIAVRYMIPCAALRGYSSETLDSQVAAFIDRQQRPVRVIYIGDFDADGEDIERNAQEWIDADEWTRVALNADQITQYALPRNPGKPLSARRRAFLDRHGMDIQVEVEALPPDVLVRLAEDAILDGWNVELQEQVKRAESAELDRLRAFIAEWEG